MNIYEALDAGNNKATFPGAFGYATRETLCDYPMTYLKRNDWFPYILQETLMALETSDIAKAYHMARHKLKEMGVNDEIINKILTTPDDVCTGKFPQKTKHKPLMTMTLEWEE